MKPLGGERTSQNLIPNRQEKRFGGAIVNLISCEDYGVVLDADMLPFPTNEECWGDVVGLDMDKAMFHEHQWRPYVTCPVCKGKVPQQ